MKDRPADPLSIFASSIGTLRRRMEQLAAVREDESQLAARVARLERVLDMSRVAAHVRSAVAGASLVVEPVPHLVAPDLLPADVYQAVIEAIPAPVFFDGRVARGQELRVPPRLAPVTVIVTWTFVNEIGRMMSDLLVARLAEPLAVYTQGRFPSLLPPGERGVEMTLSEARIVRHVPGYQGGSSADRPWDVARGVLCLRRPKDMEEFGSRLHGESIPLRANSLLACVGAADTFGYAPIPPDAPADTERYTYEFGIGPTKDARRTLTARMQKTS